MVSGRLTASYFVTVPPFNIISDVDHLAPSSCFVELFSRLIATLRVVYPTGGPYKQCVCLCSKYKEMYENI